MITQSPEIVEEYNINHNMAKTGKRRATSATRHNNVDLSAEPFTNSCPFAWPSCYSQKALCVRILCTAGEVTRCNEIPNIKRIKFITNEEESHQRDGYSWSGFVKHLSSEEEFSDTLNSRFNGFDQSEINFDYWNEICNVLDLANFKYKESSEAQNGWLAYLKIPEEDFKEKARKLSLVQQKFVGKFGAALQTDMRNCDSKSWISSLIDVLLDSCYMRDELHCDCPPLICDSNTVEIIHGDLDDPSTVVNFNAPLSSSPFKSFEYPLGHRNLESIGIDSLSETSATESVKTNRVPDADLLVMSRENPGYFPLVVEIKPSGTMSRDCFQIINHMLTKLLFQDVVFGLIISPLSYRILIIYKQNGTLHFESTHDIKFTTKKIIDNCTCESEIRLDLEKFTNMCKTIYRILMWALKTKCSLGTDGVEDNKT